MQALVTLLGMVLFHLPALGYRRLVEWLRGRGGGGVLTLRLGGRIQEDHSRPGGLGGAGQNVVLFPLLRQLRDAAEDPSVVALSVRMGRLEGGWAQLDELRRAVLDFRNTGRKAFVYLERPGHAEYFLASAFGRIAIAPMAGLHLVGLRAEISFLKGSLDLLGVAPHFEAAGDYKSAAEVFTRTDMSPEHREALDHVLSAVHSGMLAAIGEGRGLAPQVVQELVDGGPYVAEEALQVGLVDDVLYPRDWKNVIRSTLGEDLDDAVAKPSGVVPAPQPRASVSDSGLDRDGDRGAWLVEVGRGFRVGGAGQSRLSFRSASAYLRPWSRLRWLEGYGMPGPRVAVVVATGLIVDSDESVVRPGRIAYRPLRGLLRSLRKDDRVDAVVLRIDSPGGSALCSDLLWVELGRLRDAKPLVASMSSVAASGGYYLSMAADHVVASPLSVTGSIGVLAGKMDLSGLLAKIGITRDVLAYGQHSGMDSATAGLSDSERARLRSHIEANYRMFVEKAALGRHMEFDELEVHARGRIWTGAQALDHGLVDSVGTTWDAIREAGRRAAIGSTWETWLYEPPRPGLLHRLQLLASGGGMEMAAEALSGSAEELLNVRAGEWQILARLPFGVRIY
ncbi:MAG TPA: signal peptide peptidase SppA [Deltaproteobacteria bacterium]|nr:signal peptide peptidase SppA [Deltaproteobacteria bacterium]